jgi:hypothetical protein
MGWNRSRDSAILQFVFFWVKVSVAAVKIDNSTSGASEVGVLEAPGDGGGVSGSFSFPVPAELCSLYTLKKSSTPLRFGTKN